MAGTWTITFRNQQVEDTANELSGDASVETQDNPSASDTGFFNLFQGDSVECGVQTEGTLFTTGAIANIVLGDARRGARWADLADSESSSMADFEVAATRKEIALVGKLRQTFKDGSKYGGAAFCWTPKPCFGLDLGDTAEEDDVTEMEKEVEDFTEELNKLVNAKGDQSRK